MWYGTKQERKAREERVSVEESDQTPGSQNIGQPSCGLTTRDRNFFFTWPSSLPQLKLTMEARGEVVSTKHETVVFNNDRTDAASLLPCVYEEANTRLLLHAADAARHRYSNVMVRTVNVDVVVITVAKYQYISYPSFGLSLVLANTCVKTCVASHSTELHSMSTCKEVYVQGWLLLGQFLGTISSVSMSK